MKNNCVMCGKDRLNKDTIGINNTISGIEFSNVGVMTQNAMHCSFIVLMNMNMKNQLK